MKNRLSGMLGVLMIAWMSANASAIPFSFQGQLKDQGFPLTGNVDLVFELKGDAQGNAHLAGPIEHTNVPVTNGLFHLELDFPGYSFDGSPAFLEIRVRLAGGGGYETLSPLQPITAAPFAMYALDAPAGGGGSGGTLDAAYDFGGQGAGKDITADAGPVRVAGPDGLQVDGAINSGAVAINNAAADFDVQSRKTFGITGAQPEEATIGGKLIRGSPLNLIEDWAYLRVSTVGHAIRRKINTTFSFDVEGSVNNTGLWITQMKLDEDGNVGIGTPLPVAKLHVSGGTDTELGSGGFIVAGNNAGTNISIDNNEIMARNAGYISNLYLNNSGGNVLISGSGAGNLGIGTASPKGKIHVNGDYYGLGHMWLHAYEGDGSSGTAYIQARDTSSSSSVDLRFRTKSGTTLRDVMTLRSNGRVGIGTTNPSQLFEVNGTARVDVLQITGGADLSEGFDVQSETVTPGMVVSIDPTHPGRLLPSHESYDRKVAGIISGAGGIATGMVMGHDGTIANGDHPVALSGRVYCLVDATDHAVKPGDLLTSSSTVGHAMKVTQHDRANGAILGKAMTSLAMGEKGLVLVLVSLQ